MNIGIIGAGNIGATLARLFAEAGYPVTISNSRGPESLAGVVQSLGANVKAGTAEGAARFGDVVVEAIPFGHYRSLPREALSGKILISAANYYPDRDGEMDLGGRTQSQLIADFLPETSVIKAFNTIWYQHLDQQGDTSLPLGQRRVIFIAGDNVEAKAIVSELIGAIGFGAVDTGTLAESGAQEPGTAIYSVDLTVDEAKAMLGL